MQIFHDCMTAKLEAAGLRAGRLRCRLAPPWSTRCPSKGSPEQKETSPVWPWPVAAGLCRSCPPAERSGPQPARLHWPSTLQAPLCFDVQTAHGTDGTAPECRRAAATKSGSSHRRPHKSRQKRLMALRLPPESAHTSPTAAQRPRLDSETGAGRVCVSPRPHKPRKRL